MVFLALTPEGLNDVIDLAKVNGYVVWCSSEAISEEEFLALDEALLTRFAHSISFSEPEVVAGALATIREHHPGERVWIEGS